MEGQTLEAKRIIIATGSTLAFPSIPGLEEAAITTDQVLGMTEVPASVLICDSGYIEIEIAFLLNSFGSKVILATSSPRILPLEDHDTSQRIAQSLRERGVEILSRHTLKSTSKADPGSGWSCLLSGAADRSVDVQNVLVSARKPATSGMQLEQVGVHLDEHGAIRVNNRLETSVNGIYAIGDATGGWMLSHAASSMAVTAAENCMDRNVTYPFHLIPRGLWTIPEVGSVGLSEEEAEKKGLEIEVGNVPLCHQRIGHGSRGDRGVGEDRFRFSFRRNPRRPHCRRRCHGFGWRGCPGHAIGSYRKRACPQHSAPPDLFRDRCGCSARHGRLGALSA